MNNKEQAFWWVVGAVALFALMALSKVSVFGLLGFGCLTLAALSLLSAHIDGEL